MPSASGKFSKFSASTRVASADSAATHKEMQFYDAASMAPEVPTE